MSTDYSNLYKELIGESTKSDLLVKPYISFIKFDPEEILKYKDLDEINILRPIEEVSEFNVGTYVKPEWGKVYKVEDKQLYNNIVDWPYFNSLDEETIKKYTLNNHELFASLTLVRVVKKDIKRIFYDFEFDEDPSYGIKVISVGMVDEDGNELYLANKDYEWEYCTNNWLLEHVKPSIDNMPDYLKVSKEDMKNKILEFFKLSPTKDLRLYGYFSAYDHVCLCQLFGKMVNLPKGVPMYTNDLKQYMVYFGVTKGDLQLPKQANEHDALEDAKWNKTLYDTLKTKFGNKYI